MVEVVVEQTCLRVVTLFRGGQAAEIQEPLTDQFGHVDCPAGRRVVHRVVLRREPVGEDGGGDVPLVPDEVLTDDHDAEPRDPEVLLCTGVNDAEAGNIHRL